MSEAGIGARTRGAVILDWAALSQYHARTHSGLIKPLTACFLPLTSPCLHHIHVTPTQHRITAPPAMALSYPPPQQSPWTTHRPPRDLPYPTPPDDIMLTSSKKARQGPKSPYFSKRTPFFRTFLAKELFCLCMQFMTIAATNLLKATPELLLPTS